MSPLMKLKDFCDQCEVRNRCSVRKAAQGEVNYSMLEYCDALREEYNKVIDRMDKKEMVNHPSHYNQYPIETIDMMVSIFGKEYTRMWCVMTAFKYRMRLGHKDDINQDLAKEQWYLNKAKELE